MKKVRKTLIRKRIKKNNHTPSLKRNENKGIEQEENEEDKKTRY